MNRNIVIILIVVVVIIVAYFAFKRPKSEPEIAIPADAACGPRPGAVGRWHCIGGISWVNIDSRAGMSAFLAKNAGLSGVVDQMTDRQLQIAVRDF